MKISCTLFVSLFLLFAHQTAAYPESSPLCEQWQNGKCAKGPLTKLAESIKNDVFAVATRSSTCDRVCQEACPKCNLCDFCDFCGIYNDAACHDVPYFVEKDTCTVEKTNSCCKLCEVQCRKSEGVCGKKGYCKNKGDKPGVDIMSHCIAQTTGEECMPCTKDTPKP